MYERIEDLLKLCLMLQGSYGGVSLAEIERDFGVSRRTAERLRDAVVRALPQVEEAPTSDRTKRWRLPPSTLTRAAAIAAGELEEIALAAERLRHDGLARRATVLEGLLLKLRAQMQPAALARAEPDLEAMLQATGHAMRPGPRPRLQDGVLDAVREAILSCRELHLRYRKRSNGRVTMTSVAPHGVLFGQRHYLVAFPIARTRRLPALYSLGNILEARLGEASFTRQQGFDLKAYAGRAFGVFQEEPSTVAWRFPPELAADAREHHFHPTEQRTDLPDGSLELRFTAGGLQEMAWHLFTWGPGVEVVSPPELRQLYATLLRDALRGMGKRRGTRAPVPFPGP